MQYVCNPEGPSRVRATYTLTHSTDFVAIAMDEASAEREFYLLNANRGRGWTNANPRQGCVVVVG